MARSGCRRSTRDLFEGCTEAIGEVGGFSVSLDEARRLYLIEAAEKGIAWMRLTASGRARARVDAERENAVTELAEAVARIGRHEWPVRLTPTVRAFFDAAFGIELESPGRRRGPGREARAAGPHDRGHAAQHGEPDHAGSGLQGQRDPSDGHRACGRPLPPGYEEEFFATLDELLGPNVTREFLYHDIAVETTFDGPLVRAMAEALHAEDPGARAVPYTLSGGTDLKAFSRLGIRGFGFTPLKLPADFDFSAMFHGVDERVPVDSLKFGARVLDRFLDAC